MEAEPRPPPTEPRPDSGTFDPDSEGLVHASQAEEDKHGSVVQASLHQNPMQLRNDEDDGSDDSDGRDSVDITDGAFRAAPVADASFRAALSFDPFLAAVAALGFVFGAIIFRCV